MRQVNIFGPFLTTHNSCKMCEDIQSSGAGCGASPGDRLLALQLLHRHDRRSPGFFSSDFCFVSSSSRPAGDPLLFLLLFRDFLLTTTPWSRRVWSTLPPRFLTFLPRPASLRYFAKRSDLFASSSLKKIKQQPSVKNNDIITEKLVLSICSLSQMWREAGQAENKLYKFLKYFSRMRREKSIYFRIF